MKLLKIMTPGPTQVRESVRFARALETSNPDLDANFYDFYKNTCNKIATLLNTKNEVRILSGEGILGLEAACASLTEEGDRVLVIDNGIFGEGFADFIKIYGGTPVIFKGDRTKHIDVGELKKFLDNDSDFKYATIVHCDTPSGVLNDISKICPLLKQKGIITVVDSVASMAGEYINVDKWDIDIALGGSQKCISAPPGLTLLSISEDAFDVMESRKTPISSYYCNLLLWKDYYKNKWFPYTPPISDIMGLDAAIDNILNDENILKRHSDIAKSVRKCLEDAGLSLYLKNGYSSTVTVVNIPEGIDDTKVRNYMVDKYNVMIAGSFDYLEGNVWRIGHMGENANIADVAYTLFALEKTLDYFGFKCKCDMSKKFITQMYIS